jgi:hypothetical protein
MTGVFLSCQWVAQALLIDLGLSTNRLKYMRIFGYLPGPGRSRKIRFFVRAVGALRRNWALDWFAKGAGPQCAGLWDRQWPKDTAYDPGTKNTQSPAMVSMSYHRDN